MTNGSRDTQSGISFRDVAEWLRHIGKAHNGRAGFNLDLPVRSNHGVVLEVRCYLKRADGGAGTWRDVRGVSGRWPSGQSATFAGLLFRLAIELDAALGAEEEAAERAARDQPRLL